MIQYTKIGKRNQTPKQKPCNAFPCPYQFFMNVKAIMTIPLKTSRPSDVSLLQQELKPSVPRKVKEAGVACGECVLSLTVMVPLAW